MADYTGVLGGGMGKPLGSTPVQKPFGGEINPGKPMNPKWGGAQIDSGTGGSMGTAPVQNPFAGTTPMSPPLVQNPGPPVQNPNPVRRESVVDDDHWTRLPKPARVARPAPAPMPVQAPAPAMGPDPEAPGPGLDMGNGAQSVGLRRGGKVPSRTKHGSPTCCGPGKYKHT